MQVRPKPRDPGSAIIFLAFRRTYSTGLRNMAMARSGKREYIYCILLPFQFTPGVLIRGLWPSVVAKVGITTNPAERFYNIFHAFEEFGEPQSLLERLSRISESDNPIEWAKSINDIVFIEEVQYPGTAEEDIRTELVRTSVWQFKQPELKKDFLDSFTAKVPEEKRDYLRAIGMTEWIILHRSLARNLQEKFRRGRIWQPRRVPSGVELTRALKECCYQSSRGIVGSEEMIIAGGVGKGLPLFFEFKALKFKHTLSTMPVPVQTFND